MAKLTERERDVMSHALGVGRTGREYRNYFVADNESDEFRTWHGLVWQGLAISRPFNLAPDATIFHVTEAGRAALEAQND